MKNILENKYDSGERPEFSSPEILLRQMMTAHTADKRPKRIFDQKLSVFDEFESGKNLPAVRENFKRIAYQKVSELEVRQNVTNF